MSPPRTSIASASSPAAWSAECPSAARIVSSSAPSGSAGDSPRSTAWTMYRPATTWAVRQDTPARRVSRLASVNPPRYSLSQASRIRSSRNRRFSSTAPNSRSTDPRVSKAAGTPAPASLEISTELLYGVERCPVAMAV
ncbi:hypothetical protein ABZ372_23095 [Streptomyces sp. NPDC005921]